MFHRTSQRPKEKFVSREVESWQTLLSSSIIIDEIRFIINLALFRTTSSRY